MKKNAELIITILFGWTGAHRFRRNDNISGVIYLFTFGLFGIGWFFDILCCFYYRGEKFKKIKESIKDNTKKCNELNIHIEELKQSYLDVRHIDYGDADYIDNSLWNYKRPKLKNQQNSNHVYNCSLTVCKNAKDQPFKYICKYFNIKTDEPTLERFEKVFNDFSAAEQGKKLLKQERDQILNGISAQIPFLIKNFDRKNLIRKLGFYEIDFSQLYFPKYTFSYISAGGNSSMKADVILNINNLERFIHYLSDLVKFKKSVAGQRALMTSHLREQIKKRDNYTCKCCGNSSHIEPNLLLEIDHIIPLSKGGVTTEENLQTLCWKCNRKKGAKIISNQDEK